MSSNRKLKNASRADPVEVYCRIRPLPDSVTENETCLRMLDESTLMLQIPECSASYRLGQIKQLVYSFTQIFNEKTTQREIFQNVGLPLISDLLSGKNSLLFTYGVTGSGKTYTMLGNQYEYGLLQVSLDTLFNSISQKQARKNQFRPDKMNSFDVLTESELLIIEKQHQRNASLTPGSNKKQANNNNNNLNNPNMNSGKHFSVDTINKDNVFSVFINCVEIYNNYIYDLLDDYSNDYNTSTSSESTPKNSNNNMNQMNNNNMNNNSNVKESKNLKEDHKGFMYIKDVTEIEVKSSEEALEYLSRAQKKRVIASTDLNAESSRSHSIFTIRLVQASAVSPLNNITISQLSLVDLAGSERTKRTKNTGSRLREAGNINSSLMALRNCMETLRENILNGTRKMVPYRDSKLTLLFKNYFEGNGKTKMILCINPNSIEFDETVNVLKFSDLIKDVLVPTSNAPVRAVPASNTTNNSTIDSLEQSAIMILNRLQQNNYSFMNEPFPSLDLFSPDDNSTIANLISYLEEFKSKRDHLIHETDQLKQQYIVRLKEIDEEFDKLKDESIDYKNRLEQKERELSKSESKIKALEKIINTNYSISTSNPKTPSTNSIQSGTSNSKELLRQAQVQSTNSPIKSGASSVINSAEKQDGNPPSATNDTPSGISSIYRSNRVGQLSTATTAVARTYVQNVHSAASRFSGTGSSALTAGSSHNRFQSPVVTNRQPPNLLNTVTKPPGVPIANKRHQRRSRSADMWLDHKPANTAKIESVLQPKMQRKKSVSKLEINDTKKSSKYVLTHQQQDDDGEIVTNLIKGDIIKSPAGGANVIFTDVEALKIYTQEAAKPLSVKNRFNHVIDSEDKLTIEDRNLPLGSLFF